jgi:hypothetical protein
MPLKDRADQKIVVGQEDDGGTTYDNATAPGIRARIHPSDIETTRVTLYLDDTPLVSRRFRKEIDALEFARLYVRG